jgi:hypothetical protein
MQVLPLCEDEAQPADQAPHPSDAQPWGLAMPQPAGLGLPAGSNVILPGSSVEEETDQATELRTASAVSMRGAVMSLDPQGNATIVSHPATVDSGAVQSVLKLPRSTFSLRGEMMHVFVSYRVSTEGEAGNGMSGLLVEKIRALSMDRTQALPPRQPPSLPPFPILHEGCL